MNPPAAAPHEPAVVEKERRWWWWIDRWLEPRWRALLTWVVLAAVTGLMFDADVPRGALSWGAAFISDWIEPHLPFSLPTFLKGFGVLPTEIIFLCWFPGVILRIGVWRGFMWVGVATGVALAVFAITFAMTLLTVAGEDGPRDPQRFVQACFFGSFFGLPGLAVMGRRSRPWLSLAASALPTIIAFYLPFEWFTTNRALLLGGAALIYGAVMLYGTAPLARKEEAR